MKKVFFAGLLALGVAAVYFGVVTLKAGNGEFAVGFDGDRAAAVVEDVGSAAGKALEKVKSHEE